MKLWRIFSDIFCIQGILIYTTFPIKFIGARTELSYIASLFGQSQVRILCKTSLFTMPQPWMNMTSEHIWNIRKQWIKHRSLLNFQQGPMLYPLFSIVSPTICICFLGLHGWCMHDLSRCIRACTDIVPK